MTTQAPKIKNPPEYPRKVDRWQTSDGELFYSEESAEFSERDIRQMKSNNVALSEGKCIAEILRSSGRTEIPEVLERVTKDTKLIIPHWQCRDEPGYKPQEFDKTGRIFVHGHAGSWSGPYGNWMSVRSNYPMTRCIGIRSTSNGTNQRFEASL